MRRKPLNSDKHISILKNPSVRTWVPFPDALKKVKLFIEQTSREGCSTWRPVTRKGWGRFHFAAT